MPSGITHARATIMLATGLAVGAIVTKSPLGYAVGALAGLLITPDLDIDDGNISDYFIRRRAGRLAQKLWRGFWWIYATSINHRSALSHAPFIGTFARLSYIWCWCAAIILLIYLVNSNLNLRYFLIESGKIILLNSSLFIGLSAADLLHSLMDWLIKEKNDGKDI